MPDAGLDGAALGLPRPQVLTTLTSKSLCFSDAAVQSSMDLAQPTLLTLDYTRLMMGFLLFSPPRALSIAMIGLGGGSLARFILHHLPESRLKVVEINPDVLALRSEFQIPPDDERFRVRVGDGAAFVRSPPSTYDVLLVDGFGLQGQPPELASLNFYEDCANTVGLEGLVVLNLWPSYLGFERQLEDLRQVFDGNLFRVSDVDDSNVVVLASRTPFGPKFARQGWRGLNVLAEPARRHLTKAMVRVSRAFAQA